MRVCVVGSGGREHALRHVLARTATVVGSPDGADLVVVGPEGKTLLRPAVPRTSGRRLARGA